MRSSLTTQQKKVDEIRETGVSFYTIINIDFRIIASSQEICFLLQCWNSRHYSNEKYIQHIYIHTHIPIVYTYNKIHTHICKLRNINNAKVKVFTK